MNGSGNVIVKPFQENVLEYGDRSVVIYTSRIKESIWLNWKQ